MQSAHKWPALLVAAILHLGQPQAQAQSEFKVGVIAPQSAGTVGAAEQQELGMRVAIEEARKRWGVRIRVEACDDRSDPKLTLECAEKLEKSGVVAIVGSINSLCTLELPRIAAERRIPIVSAISTATRLTKMVSTSEAQPTWFFRAALSDRYQMHWLAEWLSNFRALKPDEVAFIYENTNDLVGNSSDNATRDSKHDVYGWGLRQDFLEAEPWQSYGQKPIDVGISRGLSANKPEPFEAVLENIAAGRKARNNRPVKALGLFTLWDEAREVVTFLRKDENRGRVRQAFGLESGQEPIVFAGSGAFSAAFYRAGGTAVVGAYLLSPFFVGESSAPWRDFRTTLDTHHVDASYPDPYLALGYDSMSVVASCLARIGNSTDRRAALRSCLAAGVDPSSLSLVTGLKGFDKTGEALRDLAQTSYILRVSNQNTLVSAAADDSAAATAQTIPWWRPDGPRLVWLVLGAAIAAALVLLRRKPVAVAPVEPSGSPALESPRPPTPEARPARTIAGEPIWLGSTFFFGTDPISQRALQVARKACEDASDKKPVVIMGPPGVGKTQLAQLIHKSSPRGATGKAFVVIDCATITDTLFDSELAGAARGAYTGATVDRKGLLEAADGGTALLDEIGELSPELQARMLRFLQNSEIRSVGSTVPRKLDVRIIAATNKDISAFRPDLWGRLSQGNLVIEIPPIDAHSWDIPAYVDGLLERYGNGVCISNQALEILTGCSWRGNFRSLGCANESRVPLGLLGQVAGDLAGGIVTPQALHAAMGLDPETRSEIARAVDRFGIALPPEEHPDTLFPDGMDRWFAKAEPRRAWETILDMIFNRLRGPQNENFLLASKDSKRLAVTLQELSTVLGLPDTDAVLKSLRTSRILTPPEELREKEISEPVAQRHRRWLVLFAKRTHFLRLSHDELAEVSGVNRPKYYNFYHHAFRQAEPVCTGGVVPPMSRYVIDHRGEAERSDRRAPFANAEFERRAGQVTDSFARLRKLLLLPGRARS